MRFHAFHGAIPQENIVGGDYSVTLTLRTGNISGAIERDDLTQTINYADIYAVVAAEMRTPSALLEHVAGRIVRRLLEDFPLVVSVRIELSKEHPPIPRSQMAAATVVLEVVR